MKLPRSSVTRARATRLEQDARVKRIVEMMAKGEWYTGRSHAELAGEWGTTIDVVEKVASTASKVVRVLVQVDPDEMRARMMAALEENRARAVEGKRPDLKAANQSVAIQAQLLGLATTNVNTRIVDSERVANMTPQEKLEECLRVRAELDEEIVSLRKQLKGAA